MIEQELFEPEWLMVVRLKTCYGSYIPVTSRYSAPTGRLDQRLPTESFK